MRIKQDAQRARRIQIAREARDKIRAGDTVKATAAFYGRSTDYLRQGWMDLAELEAKQQSMPRSSDDDLMQ